MLSPKRAIFSGHCPGCRALCRIVAGCAVALHLLLATSVTAQIVVEPLELATPDGPARGYIATIDLSANVNVTAAMSPLDPDGAVPLQTVSHWAGKSGFALGINANYFAKIAGEPRAMPLGLVVENGQMQVAQRSFRGRGDPVLVVRRPAGSGGQDQNAAQTVEGGLVAEVMELSGPLPESQNVVAAVAGIGASETDPGRGGLIVTDGKNTGKTARVEPESRHPRTAAGVSADGRTLVLVVIDGRQKDWSVGVTLAELAELLIERGVDDALNLDGGGSSVMVHAPPGEAPRVITRPSDGKERPVAVALGVSRVDNTQAAESEVRASPDSPSPDRVRAAGE